MAEKLQVILELVTGQYKREAREAATATGKIGDAAQTASGGANRLTTGLGGMALAAKAAGAALAAAAVTKFAVDSIHAASNLEESINAVNVVFGNATGIIENFGQVSANAVGLSTREFNQLATVTGGFLTNLGFNQQQAARETVTLTQRASDMASVFNTDVGSALEAVNSALKGEFNPIEQFAVKISDADVRARAVALGLAETTAAVDQNAKAVATLNLIYEQTAKTQGDFAATSDSLANSQRRAAAAMENAQARFGRAVTPAIANLMDRFAEGVERVAAAFGDKAAAKSIVFNEAMKELNEVIAAGTLGTEDLANSLLHIALNADLTTEDFLTLASAVGLSEDQFAIFAESLLKQAEELGLAPEVIDELRKALEGAGGAAKDTVDPTNDAAAALKGYETAAARAAREARAVASAQRAITQALLEAANPAFAAASAIGRLRDAQATLADVQADSTSSAEAIAEAYLDLAEAKLEAQGALDAFDASGVTGAASAIATALGIPYEAALALLETLDLIDGKVVTATVITSFIDRRDAASGGGGSGRTYIGGRQHGGPVSALRPYLIGEDGPEVMWPSSSGTVMSNADMRRWMEGAGRSVNITVQSPMKEFRPDLQYATLMASVLNMVETQS
jgi:hypothetical protein